MKILIVNASDIHGGAARAAYRLHQSLLANNVDSQMLVQSKSSDDYTVLCSNSKIKQLLNKLKPAVDALPFLFCNHKVSTLFSCAWLPSRKLIKKINEINPDIVHLHWINGGMIKIEDLAKINAPIVWSLHDMWPLGGGWHYDEPLATRAQKRLSNKILQRKQKTYLKIKNMTIVGLSRWLQSCALNSTVLKNKNIINLPNPIDTRIYKPFDKKLARELWGLPKNKKLVLFGAMGATSDPRKGLKELSEALSNINRTDMEFVVFGSSKPQSAPKLGCKIHYVGTLGDDVSLVTLYSAVDVMIVPSLQENLSNAIMESLACATPVVAFSIGGNADMIEHQKNGYLAVPFDTSDLAQGIEWVLDNEKYQELCLNAQEKVVREFDSQIVADKYTQLYTEILDD
jgi:glycosyltransferase involved in cell wall biosynthesis